MKIQPGSLVELSYRITGSDGKVFDSSDDDGPMVVEFGITPASIGKVKAAPQDDEEEKKFQLLLFNGGKADTPRPRAAPTPRARKKQKKGGTKRAPRRRQ